MAGQRGQERVPAMPVDLPHPPQVPVEITARDELGQRELLQRRRAAVGGDLRLRHGLGQVTRQDEPSQPQARCQRLACRPGVHDKLGSQSL